MVVCVVMSMGFEHCFLIGVSFKIVTLVSEIIVSVSVYVFRFLVFKMM